MRRFIDPVVGEYRKGKGLDHGHESAILSGQTSTLSVLSSQSQVSFNPHDKKQVCVTGKEVFRLYEFKRGGLRMVNSFKVEKMNILCHTWMSSDSIIAGTDKGQLLILKSKRLQRMGKACER